MTINRNQRKSAIRAVSGIFATALIFSTGASAQDKKPSPSVPSSYAPVVDKETFEAVKARMEAAKPEIMERQKKLLNERYDLSDRPAKGVTMSKGKAVQEGVRVKLPNGTSWQQLAGMSPDAIRDKNLFPAGFLPLSHPNHAEGGMVFPQFHIDEIKKQEGEKLRDLTRFDLDFDLPDHLLPEFPAPIFLTSRPDLGDVSQGKLVTTQNYYELFNGILTPKQLDGVRLLVSPLMQQQFNMTGDRRTDTPSAGVTCFDCHANGHVNGATHLDPQTRPQEFRRRLDVPTLRGVNIQRLFGSQRALRSIEDFTEFEQRGAYFDGDNVIATKKGVRILERGSEVANMSEFQSLLDFPPAPKLDPMTGKLDAAKASKSEMAGQELFFGKANCGSCHQAPFYTDNLMHDLKTERFYKTQMVNGKKAAGDGPIKTFPLRGIKDSPTYLHDGRLLTLDDTVEFFNVVLGTKLTDAEKKDLVAFLRTL
ncbi:MAG: cytochrome B6 [Pseudomonadota bacterium]|nr:cytochrome B6 [Pseudomonadota bacterium]